MHIPKKEEAKFLSKLSVDNYRLIYSNFSVANLKWNIYVYVQYILGVDILVNKNKENKKKTCNRTNKYNQAKIQIK